MEAVKIDTAIIYKSKTGFTKTYAEWIQQELSCDIFNFKGFSKAELEKYDTVIFGSRVHAGIVDDLKKFKEIAAEYPKIKLVVFATGATPNGDGLIEEMWKNNFTEDELNSIPHFYFQSGLNYDKMGVGDKMMMKMLKTMLSGKKDPTDADKEMAKMIGGSYDISSKDCIKPLVECVRGIAAK